MGRRILAVVASVAVLCLAGCGDAASDAECTNFASGSLSDTALVPSTRKTGLGVTLEFDELVDAGLEMSVVCTSNGEVLQSGPVGQAPGFGFEVEIEGAPYRVEFAWVPGVDIEYSVAVMSL